jgi:hypothetical protein
MGTPAPTCIASKGPASRGPPPAPFVLKVHSSRQELLFYVVTMLIGTESMFPTLLLLLEDASRTMAG